MPKAFDSWNVLPHGPIEKLSDNLWRVEGDLPNMPLKRQMVLCRMADGRLLIHSAIALEEEHMAQIERWGKPAFIVVPNGWHRLDSANFKRRYPEARVLCPAGARKHVRQAVAVDGSYDDLPEDDCVALHHLEGIKRVEGVLCVRSTDGLTLVFNDLLFNLPHGKGLFGLIFRYVTASTGGPKISRITRWLIIKNRAALRRQLMHLSSEAGLRRLIPGHGAVIDDNAPAVLRALAATI